MTIRSAAVVSGRPARLTAAAAEVGATAGPMTITGLDRDAFVAYGAASGDFWNPVHWDPEFARAAGHRDVFASGMFTMGLLGSFLSSWLGAESIRRFRVRFVNPLWRGELVRCFAVVAAVDAAAGGVLVSCDARAEGKDGELKVSGAAEALLRLA